MGIFKKLGIEYIDRRKWSLYLPLIVYTHLIPKFLHYSITHANLKNGQYRLVAASRQSCPKSLYFRRDCNKGKGSLYMGKAPDKEFGWWAVKLGKGKKNTSIKADLRGGATSCSKSTVLSQNGFTCDVNLIGGIGDENFSIQPVQGTTDKFTIRFESPSKNCLKKIFLGVKKGCKSDALKMYAAADAGDSLQYWLLVARNPSPSPKPSPTPTPSPPSCTTQVGCANSDTKCHAVEKTKLICLTPTKPGHYVVNGLVKTCSNCIGGTPMKKTECSLTADTVCKECLANLDCGDGQLCNTSNECRGCSAETSGSKCKFEFNLVYNTPIDPTDLEGKCMSKTENNVEVSLLWMLH